MAPLLRRAAALGVACALLPGCWYFTRYGMALKFFSDYHLCPVDRITVHQVDPEPPPAEIAADPERLAMWQARNGGDQYAYYRLVGCGSSSVYRCHRMGKCGIHSVDMPSSRAR